MKRWEVRFPIGGSFDFSGDFEIVEVTFSKNRTNKEYEAKITVEAENKENAIKNAQEMIENVLDVIYFVREVGFDIGRPYVFQKDSNEIVQFTRSEVTPIITDVHKRIIMRVYENLEPMFKDKDCISEGRKRALLALRWYRHGCFFSNPTDKFLALWIAVESLTGDGRKLMRDDLPFEVKDCIDCVKDKGIEGNTRSQIIQSIHETYRSIPVVITENIKNILKIDDDKIDKIKEKIQQIQRDRSGIVHYGNVQIDVAAHNRYLKQLMEKLLREELGAAFDNFIDLWPTTKQRETLSDDHPKLKAIKYVLSKHSEGATIDEIEYGLFSLTKRIGRPKDLHANLEFLRKNGDIRTNDEGLYFGFSG